MCETVGCEREAWVRGKCRRCYYRRVNDLVRFGGHREAVMSRDAQTCQVCGAKAQLVHHRKYDPQDPNWQLSLCRPCHARIHRLATLRRFLPAKLVDLWAEANPGKPAQLGLPLE
jgi:5-methylcytosine-specific restriction endonuclease McrA